MADQNVFGPTLRDEVRLRRNIYLRRITQWERTATSDEGVVQIRRRFAGSQEVPPEAPFETEERKQIEKRYGDNVSSYGDWESLRIIRNELNLNRMTAWLLWLKEESAQDPSVVGSARNPFRAEMLPGNQPLFGVLPPAAHLPALEQTVGFAGVVCALRRCGASLANQSFASVFQTIAGLQTLKRPAQTLDQGQEERSLMPTDRLAADIDRVVKDYETNQGLREQSLKEHADLDGKIAASLSAARPPDQALFAAGQSFTTPDAAREAVVVAWGDAANEVLSNLSVTLSPATIGVLLDWLTAIYAAMKSPAKDADRSPPVTGWESPPVSGWEKPPTSGWEKPPVTGWESPPRSGWEPPHVPPDHRPAWDRAVLAIETIASLERLNRRSFADGIRAVVQLVLGTFGWGPAVESWLDYAVAHQELPLRAAAMLEFPGIYAVHLHGADAFQFPPYTGLGVRWCANVLIPSTIGHILALKDTADFHVTDHLRFIYLFDAGRLTKDPGVLPPEIRPFFEAAILRFKFSVEDAHSFAKEEMTFWSENHQVLFASCEYLAGQLWPDREFQHADGAGDKHDGAWHRDRAGTRLRRWLDKRMTLGFSEWNAPGYYNEDFPPLLNVADFCRDAGIASMARTVIDLMVFDLARFTCQGNFGVTAGRAYLEHKRVAWDQSIGDGIELLFGARGDFLSPNETTAIALATSSYLDDVPEVLIAIGRDRSSIFVDSSRVSGSQVPIDGESPEDILFWWGNGAYFTTQTYDATLKWARRWHLLETGPFKALLFTGDNLWERFGLALAGAGGSALLGYVGYLLPFPVNIVFIAVAVPGIIRGILDTILSGVDLVLEFFEDAWDTVIGWFGADTDDDDAPRISRPAVLEILKRLLIDFNSGSVLSTACLRTFRTADVMLSSAVNHRPGEISFQKQTCIAVIGQNASVWTTKPLGEADTAAGVGRGLVNLVETTPAQWLTTMALPWANRPYDGLANVALPFLKDATLPGGHDGPNWWTGTASLPDVWQVDNVAVQLYKPSDNQRTLSKNITHAWFPKDAFDQIRWEPSGHSMWVMGRRDRRFPPQNPRNPADPPASDDGQNRKISDEPPGKGSGYVALYSAKGFKWANGAFKDCELEAEDHDNIFITIVGDQAMFGSFDRFADAILGCGLSASVSDMTCSLHIPTGKGPVGSGKRFEVEWNTARLDGVAIQMLDWPRFENQYVHGRNPGRVEANERQWRITITTPNQSGPPLELFHDSEHPEKRNYNRQVRVNAVAAATSKRGEVSGGRRLRERAFSRK
jgi:hypothetical protein